MTKTSSGILFVVIVSLFGCASAYSQDLKFIHDRGFYAGANFMYVKGKGITPTPADEDDVQLPVVELVGGYKYNPLLGIELRYGKGTNERTVGSLQPAIASDFEYRVADYSSVYYRAELMNEEAKIYALIGYMKLNVDEQTILNDAIENEEELSASGVSFGLGVGWFVNEHANINIEYRRLSDSDEGDYTMTSIGFDYRFDLF